jgi:hypothetical protein
VASWRVIDAQEATRIKLATQKWRCVPEDSDDDPDPEDLAKTSHILQ